jgi:prevent-host-death family protein
MAREISAVKDEVPGSSETVITATEVQDRLGDVLDRAMAGERFRVTRHGRDRAIVLGCAEYERLRKLAGIKQRRVATAV